MIEFDAHIVLEGQKKKGDTRNRKVTMPAEIVSRLPWRFPAWVRVQVGDVHAFVVARRPTSRPSVEITLPSWRFGKLAAGVPVHVAVDAATSHRAKPARAPRDWLAELEVVDGAYFPSDEADSLVIWGLYGEPFVLRRIPQDEIAHWWLLGFYQAEGSTSASANDFHVANTNPALLQRMVAALKTWGISRERLYMGVLHRRGMPAKPAVAMFESVGVTITHVTAKPKNDATGVLHVYRSMPLMRLVRERLRRLAHDAFPSKAAARAYALGWLDGDGSIAEVGASGWSIGLRLAGYRDEQEIVLRALEQGFDWTFQRGAYGLPRSHTERVLSLLQAAELAVAPAFTASLNRARLIHMLAGRLPRHWSKIKGRTLTTKAEAVQAQNLFDTQLSAEATALARHPLAPTGFRTGFKGEPYPQEKGHPDHRPGWPFEL